MNLFFGKLSTLSPIQGKDQGDLLSSNIHGPSQNNTETQTQDRSNWRCSIATGTKIFEDTRREKGGVKRQEKKTRQNQPRPLPR